MMEQKIKHEDNLLFIGKKKYLIRLDQNKFTTEFGDFNLGALVGKAWGTKVKTHLGYEFIVVPPRLPDLMKKLKRAPQIITLKDAGIIAALTGLSKDDMVVEAGTGSGALTVYLAGIAKHIYTYEIRKDFYDIARTNFEKLGIKNITTKNKDITKGIDEGSIDLVALDMEFPEKAFKVAHKALKVGGYLVVFAPVIEQVSRFRNFLDEKHFANVETYECILRPWQIEPPDKSRPSGNFLAHTGFLTFARKI
ncbi:TPA: methyltransferase domain-containing protein [archaeon]|uniref:Methyltransferase domain-containing protein n=1 Tax=Candidatus Naiadarchaeum limnaeum TaxID=2756139 RepID=A0A832V3K3_9ARCH|nr:methyltransferase domain-containing protein [Candidatus Naiadarchaeum limnaeum]